MEEKNNSLRGILTLGGILGVAIASSFIIRGYLDLLRIKALKRELNTSTGKINLMSDE